MGTGNGETASGGRVGGRAFACAGSEAGKGARLGRWLLPQGPRCQQGLRHWWEFMKRWGAWSWLGSCVWSPRWVVRSLFLPRWHVLRSGSGPASGQLVAKGTLQNQGRAAVVSQKGVGRARLGSFPAS